MTHSVVVTGAVPWARDGMTTDPSAPGQDFVLVTKPIFRDGVLVALEFSNIEYCFFTKSQNGKSFQSAVARPVADKDKYPHWPNPEPTENVT